MLTNRDLQKNSQFKADVFNPTWESMRRPELIEVDGGVCLGGKPPVHRHTDTDIKGGVVSSPGGPQAPVRKSVLTSLDGYLPPKTGK